MTSELAGRTVLVTGASGFIGSHVCGRLADLGAHVHGVSRRPGPVNGSTWWQGRLEDGAFVSSLVASVRPDVVFHLAGHVDGSRSLEQVRLCLNSNLVSTVHLLTAATETGCDRIVLVGSLDEPSPGEAADVPASPYAASKWACGDYARMFHSLFETPIVIGRPFMVYGPGQRDRGKIVPYVTTAFLRNEAPLLSSGDRPVDWIYIDDVTDGLLRLASAPDVDGRTIDLGWGTLVSVRDMVVRLFDIIRPDVELSFGERPERPFEQVRKANLADTTARIGWVPKVPLSEGLARTVAWFSEHP